MPRISVGARLAEKKASPGIQAGRERPDREKSRGGFTDRRGGETDAEDHDEVDPEDRVVEPVGGEPELGGQVSGGSHAAFTLLGVLCLVVMVTGVGVCGLMCSVLFGALLGGRMESRGEEDLDPVGRRS